MLFLAVSYNDTYAEKFTKITSRQFSISRKKIVQQNEKRKEDLYIFVQLM